MRQASIRPPHHPPQPGDYSPPTNELPGYINGTAAVAGFGSRDFYIATLPRATACQIIRERHYSKRIVNNSFIHLGVWLQSTLRGVLQFGYALNPRRADRFVAGTQVGEYLELNRMWLDDVAPRNSESRALSYAFKYIKRACPRVA